MTKFTKQALFAGLALALATGPLAAAEIKIAMNGVNDPETNAEAAKKAFLSFIHFPPRM